MKFDKIVAKRRKRGFALVVTLALMVLLSLLAVGLLGLSSVELRSSGRDSDRKKAQANARLALQVAIGELQKELGPDKRVTIPGGQKIQDPSDSGRRHWIGVYDSWDSAMTARPAAPVFRKWLISGDEAAVLSEDAAEKKDEKPLAAKTVPLVKGNAASSQAEANEPLEAGLVEVPSGAYAWWIGDNAMKAKIGNALPASPTADDAIAGLQSAPRVNPDPMLSGATPPADPRWNALVSLETSDLLGATSPAFFHDATNLSNGLMTNVRAGGLRKDLSFLMEKAAASGVSGTPLYTAGSSSGISLQQLWAAHQVWGERQTTGLPAHADGSSLPSGTPYLTPPATPALAEADPFLQYRQFTQVRSLMVFSFISEIDSATGQYNLCLIVDPVFTIWNPFDVTLYIPSSTFTTFKNWAIPYQIDITAEVPNGPPRKVPVDLHDLFGVGFTNARVGYDQVLVLRPGEVQVVSQAYDKNATWRDGGASNSQSNARLGYDFGAGFKFKISKKTQQVQVPDPNNPAQTVTKTVPRYPDLEDLPGATRISYGMTPTGKRAYDSIVLAGHSIGTGSGSFNLGALAIGISAPGAKATDNPTMFPAIAPDPSFNKTMEQLAVTESIDKWPICVYEYGFKPESDNFYTDRPARSTGRFLQWNNPKAYAVDLIDIRPTSDYPKMIPLQVSVKRVDNHSEITGVDCDAAGLGYFGGGYSASDGVSYIVTHSVPSAPIHSLGALQHAIASLPAGMLPSDKMAKNKTLLPFVGHAISNSFAPSVLAPSSTTGTIGTGYSLRDLADHSYLLNRALWDDYFYSSVSPKSVSSYKNSSTAQTEQKERLRKFLGVGGLPSEPLPNSRFLPCASDPEEVLNELFPGSGPAPDAHEKMSASLVIDGAFNVNSTSVAAWKGFLSSLKSSAVPVRNAKNPSATPVLETATGTPVLAGLVASGNEIDEGDLANAGESEPWVGFRNLTDSQIDELAQAVVKQVKQRGPFLSLADFVNRRPGTDKKLAVSGALQSALDDDDVSINKPFRQHRATGSVSGYAFAEAEQGAKAVGSAGYVKQADLLTPLAPFLAVRGDTFTIRAYGEVRDASDHVTARAWCEAVVQRYPEYTDPQERATVAAPVQSVNQIYGRRFQIVAFRYLHPSEVL